MGPKFINKVNLINHCAAIFFFFFFCCYIQLVTQSTEGALETFTFYFAGFSHWVSLQHINGNHWELKIKINNLQPTSRNVSSTGNNAERWGRELPLESLYSLSTLKGVSWHQLPVTMAPKRMQTTAAMAIVKLLLTIFNLVFWVRQFVVSHTSLSSHHLSSCQSHLTCIIAHALDTQVKTQVLVHICSLNCHACMCGITDCLFKLNTEECLVLVS